MKTETWSRNITEQITSKNKCIFHSSRIICRPDKFVAAEVHLCAFKASHKTSHKISHTSHLQKIRLRGIVAAPETFSRSTDVTSSDLVSAKGKQRKCIVVVLIVLFWCFWWMKDCNAVSVYWNIVWWSCETISISWLLFSHLPKLGQLMSVDRENGTLYHYISIHQPSAEISSGLHSNTACSSAATPVSYTHLTLPTIYSV